MSLNRVILIGRLVKDPVTKNVNGGDNTTFRIAVDRNYVPKGKDKPDTDFFDVCLWNSCAKYAAKYFKKGNQVYVLGSIENNNYEGKNGKVFSDRVNGTETGFAEGRKADSSDTQEKQTNSAEAVQGFKEMGFTPMTSEFDDDLPFGMN